MNTRDQSINPKPIARDPDLFHLVDMKFLTLAVAVLLTLFAVGCQSTSGDASTQPTDLKQYRSFAVSSLPTEGPASDPLAPARLAAPARDAVVQTLLAKGYSEASASEADMLVTMRGEFMRDGLQESSAQRMLTIEILDNHSKKRIWMDQRGRSGSESLPPDILQKTIAQMLEPFPAASVFAPK